LTDQLHLEIVNEPDATIVIAVGEIDLATGDQLVEVLTELCGEKGAVRVDLGQVSFMDSTGIKALVNAHRLSEERGCQLTICNPTERLRRVLEVSGVDQVLNVTD